MIPKPIQHFIELFSRLPSVGPRLATRLAFYLADKDNTILTGLEEALAGLQKLDRCKRCFFLKSAGETLCDICRDTARDPSVIAIVEKETDLITIEQTGKFRGHYFVLGELAERGVLESGQRARLRHLKTRIDQELGGKAKELILAFNLNSFGDFTATLSRHIFKNSAHAITRIGRGIPTGGAVEFSDEETIVSAFERRS